MRILGFQDPAQLSPTLGDALNAGFRYLEVKCLGATRTRLLLLTSCGDRRTPSVHEPERYMRCKDCSQVRSYPFKRSHLVALRATRSRRAIRRQRGGRASETSHAICKLLALADKVIELSAAQRTKRQCSSANWPEY